MTEPESSRVTLTRSQFEQLAAMADEFSRLQSRLQSLESRPDPQPTTREPHVSSPSHFSGNRAELRNFLSQVRLVIDVQPSRFQSERQKVLYAASFLRDTAYSWFEPLLHQSPAPSLLDDFGEFTAKLSSVFGDPDQTASAERDIRHLRQRSSASAYAAEFQRLAAYISWNDSALASQFYWGLSDAVKDDMAQIDRPGDLATLIATAIRIDTRQTERKLEQRYRAPGHIFSPAPPQHQPFTQQRPQTFATRPPPSTPSSSFSPMDIESTISRKRAPLSAEERERRRRNNLCMYCGQPGHFASTCPVRPPGRVAAASYSNDPLFTQFQQFRQFMQSMSTTPTAPTGLPNTATQGFPPAQDQ